MNIKALTGLLFLSVGSFACADTGSSISLAKSNLASSIAKFSDKEMQCKSGVSALPKDKLTELNLSKEEIVSALSFHYLKSYTQCSYAEAADLVVRLQVISLMQMEPSESEKTATEIIVSDMKKLLDLEVEYNSIPEQKRKKIESIPGINKPFDMIKTAQSLGI